MSSQFYEILTTLSDPHAEKRLINFVKYARQDDLAGMAELDTHNFLGLKWITSHFIDLVEFKKRDGVYSIVFGAECDLDPTGFPSFLLALGSTRLEASVLGEDDLYTYVLNTDCAEDFYAFSWEWLENPEQEWG